MRAESYLCHVCRNPVNLETSITDECGRAMHQDCCQAEFGATDVASSAELEKTPFASAG